MAITEKSKVRLLEFGLFITTVIWGSTFFIVKENVAHFSPLLLVGYRFLIAALILGTILYLKGYPLLHGIKRGLILGVILFSIFAPQALGLKYTSASNSGFITGMFVVFIPIFSRLIFKQKTTINKWFSIIISLFGLLILTGGLSSLNMGDAITLISAVAISLHILVADKFVKKQNPIVLAFQEFFVAGSIATIAAVVFNRSSLVITSRSTLFAILFLAIFPSLGAYVIQLLSQKRVPAVRVALIFALEPVFAAFFSWTLGNEAFVPSQAIGGSLIFIAIIISDLNFGKPNLVDEDIGRLGG